MINDKFLDVNYNSVFSLAVSELEHNELVDFVAYCWAKNLVPNFALLKQWRRAYPVIKNQLRRGG